MDYAGEINMGIHYPIRSPSVNRLRSELGFSRNGAQKFKTLCERGQWRAAINLANLEMSGFGTESLYPEYPGFWYVNMGDTYDRTLYYTGASFQIGAWGDWVERHPVRSETW